MITDAKKRLWVCLIPWALPFLLIIPYAVFVEKFRLLYWVWATFYPPFWGLLLFTVISALFCTASLLRAWKLGRMAFNLSAGIVLFHITYLAMVERRHSILVLIFLLCILVIFLSEQMRKILLLPYFDSKRSWWESQPKALPGIKAFLSEGPGGAETEVRVSNLGQEGCFIFLPTRNIQKIPNYIKLKAGDKIIMESGVALVFRTKDKLGAGLEYTEGAEAAGDWSKDYLDFLSYLRRAGYAQV